MPVLRLRPLQGDGITSSPTGARIELIHEQIEEHTWSVYSNLLAHHLSRPFTKPHAAGSPDSPKVEGRTIQSKETLDSISPRA